MSRRRGSRDEHDLGIVLVHGIGDSIPGATLAKMGEPIVTWISQSLTARSAGAESISDIECRGCGIPGMHRHLRVTLRVISGRLVQRRWLITECYWRDLVADANPEEFWRWLRFAAPLLPLWQTGTSAWAGASKRATSRWKWSPLSWYAYACNTFWSFTIRPAIAYILLLTVAPISALLLPLSAAGRRGRALKYVLAPLVDVYSFAAEPSCSQRIRDRWWSTYKATSHRCRRVVVIGHSQGGALSHAAMREHGVAPAAFIGLGSGLGPLRPAAGYRPGRLSPARMIWHFLLGMTGYAMGAQAAFSLMALMAWLLSLLALALIACVAGTALFLIDSILQGPTRAYQLVLKASTLHHTPSQLALIFFVHAAEYINRALVFAVIAACILLLVPRYLRPSRRARREFEVPQLAKSRWYEFSSPFDPVSIGAATNTFATHFDLQNPSGWRLWKEHGSYCAVGSEVLPRVGRLVLQLEGAEGLSIQNAPRESARYRGRRVLLAVPPVLTWLFVVARHW